MTRAKSKGLVEVFLHLWEQCPIVVNELPGFIPAQTAVSRKTIRLHAIKQSEIDRLRDPAKIWCHVLWINSVDQTRGRLVNVFTTLEGVNKKRFAATVGHKSQFDL